MAESLVFDQAGVPSGKPHDEAFRHHGAEKFGLSDATPAEQANQNKTARSKARSKDEPVPDRSFFATRAALDSKRISCEVSAWTDVQQNTDVKMRIPWKVETLAGFAFAASNSQSRSEVE